MTFIKQAFSTLFSLGFMIAGVFLFLETAWPMFQDCQTMQNWQQTQAELIEVKIFKNRTTAKYNYNMYGESVTEDRVYVANFNDNIGDYHQTLSRRLNLIKNQSQQITIWVSPDNYNQAVIDRDMRWGLFSLTASFCMGFILIGFLIAYKTIRSPNKVNNRHLTTTQLRREWENKLDNPEFDLSFIDYRRQRLVELGEESENKVNWQSRKGWGKSSISSNAKTSLYVMWGLSIFWYLALSPLLFNFQDELNKGNTNIWWGLILPIAGLFVLYKAIILTLEYRRFGEVYYEMGPYPGAIGGQVGGRIVVPQLSYKQLNNQPSKIVEVKLECVYSYVSGSDENRSHHEDISWAQVGEPKFEQRGKGIGFAFNYDIPAHLAESTIENKSAYYFWRLTLKVDIKGVDLNRTFVIPVFKGEKTSRFISHSISEQVIEKKQLQSEQTRKKISKGDFKVGGLAKSMSADDLGHTLFLRFPIFRNVYLALFCVCIASGFGFASYFLVGGAYNSGYFGILIGIISIPFLLVALFTAVAAIYLPLANLKVIINSEQIQVLKRWSFIPIYIGSMKVSKLKNINILRTGSVGSGVNKIESFKLQITNNIGQTMTIAEDVEGKDTALQFAEYLCLRFNIQAQPVYVKNQNKFNRQKNSELKKLNIFF